ncbi:MAG: cobalamin-dependent protein, partial [Clostridia bacterium]|nr:cobalamin-dependent protein [Clostridia bacterium]
AIAERIAARAEALGIPRARILFDPLTLTVSAGGEAPAITLKALKLLRDRLGAATVLGVSNVSFGLPSREIMNSAFLVMALESGLKAAILNPLSAQMMGALHAWRALRALDENCGEYIDFASRYTSTYAAVGPRSDKAAAQGLSGAVERGLKAEAAALTREAIAGGSEALSLVEAEIIPALNRIGEAYEQKRAFLPQLLLAAEAAQSAFSVIKENVKKAKTEGGMLIILATVKGDVHDIGKNIVKLLLENYGYQVYDLGRDVAPARIAEEAVRLHAPLVGLSALMTTTVPAMEETIRLLRREAPFCRIMVGGAVLTEAYARSIGADAYGRDAMAAVRIAQGVMQETGEGAL